MRLRRVNIFERKIMKSPRGQIIDRIEIAEQVR